MHPHISERVGYYGTAATRRSLQLRSILVMKMSRVNKVVNDLSANSDTTNLRNAKALHKYINTQTDRHSMR